MRLVEQLRAPFGVTLDQLVLGIVERPRLLEDRVGNRELADVMDEAADRERPQPVLELHVRFTRNGIHV